MRTTVSILRKWMRIRSPFHTRDPVAAPPITARQASSLSSTTSSTPPPAQHCLSNNRHCRPFLNHNVESAATVSFLSVLRARRTLNRSILYGASSLTGPRSFNQGVLIDTTPLPASVPPVKEIGASSAPLMSASFFIGARCKAYNDDYMKCKTEAFGTGEVDCMREGRKVTRCAASV